MGGLPYDGQQSPIIDPERWDAVQTKLKLAAARPRGKTGNIRLQALLKGKLFDETGDRLTPSHANKGGRRYRYYISHRLARSRAGTTSIDEEKSGWRLPAKEFEQQLGNAIGNHLEQAIPRELLRNADVELIQRLSHQMCQSRQKSQDIYRQQLLSCLQKAEVRPGTISIILCPVQTAKFFQVKSDFLNPDVFSFASSFQFRKRGVETKLIIGKNTNVNIDTVLIRNIALAHAIYQDLKSGKTMETIAEEVGLSKRRILQLIDHAFLSPQILKSILEGTQPLDLTTEWLQRNQVPSCWNGQKNLFATL